MEISFDIESGDYAKAGYASSEVKKLLKTIGVPPKIIRRFVVSLYEAEVNVVAHSYGGKLTATFEKDRVMAVVEDTGPGIADIDLAMTKGWSTATDTVRQMGFGAGMGLPNISKNSDELNVQSELGKGTTVTIVNYLVK